LANELIRRRGMIFRRRSSEIACKSTYAAMVETYVVVKWRRSIEALAQELNPVIQGVMNYYCKFWSYHTHYLWHQLNKRLKKWVKWEKRLYKMASVQWLKKKHGRKTEPIRTLEVGISMM
jgi:hypothetical protein